MILYFHKNFTRAYKKLNAKLQRKVDSVIDLFQDNPKSLELKNHALKGRLVGQRAIYVTGDLRIIFEEHDDYMLVIMLDLGTHNQVY